jgi:hypothetical protein
MHGSLSVLIGSNEVKGVVDTQCSGQSKKNVVNPSDDGPACFTWLA